MLLHDGGRQARLTLYLPTAASLFHMLLARGSRHFRRHELLTSFCASAENATSIYQDYAVPRPTTTRAFISDFTRLDEFTGVSATRMI